MTLQALADGGRTKLPTREVRSVRQAKGIVFDLVMLGYRDLSVEVIQDGTVIAYYSSEGGWIHGNGS